MNFNSILNYFNERNAPVNIHAHEYNKMKLAQTVKGILIIYIYINYYIYIYINIIIPSF